jgi:hypothetical protein
MAKNKERYTFHIPEGPDAYSERTWTVPDADTFRNEILTESMIYHVGHLVEDCEVIFEDLSVPIGHDKQGNITYRRHLSKESESLRKIRKIAQEESAKGRVVLLQKKIRAGSAKPEKAKGPIVYGKTDMRRSQTKPIFEYHSHPVQNTG